MAKMQTLSEHDFMIQDMANFLVEKKFNDVRANIDGFEKPEIIVCETSGFSYTPDLTAQGKRFNIFEIETSKSINDKLTEQKWGLFASVAKNKDALFYLIVPKSSVPDAHQRMTELNIEADIMGV